MKPAWDQLAEAHNEGGKVVIADVDCTVHRGLCQEHGVRGYPTIKYYLAGGEGQKYQGGRDFAALNKHVESTLL